jgi:mono/diheme cytochrome c family protein
VSAMPLGRSSTRGLRFAFAGALLTCAMVASGCGRPTIADESKSPAQVTDFTQLYERNCSGCHGADGKFGPAPPLNDPLFLEIIPEAEFLRTVREGRKGTLMPAFARKSGGTLTDEQISIIALGVRNLWAKPVEVPRESIPDYLPPAAAQAAPSQANVEAGQQVFAKACAGCHGERGDGGLMAGPLRNASFLSLISDQALRRIVITGRADLEMPNFVALGKTLNDGKPLTSAQIADVVALLASWRTAEEPAKAAAAKQ